MSRLFRRKIVRDDGDSNLKGGRSMGPSTEQARLVMQEAPPKRKIVTLSGSSRFIDVMAVAAWKEEQAGHIALSCHLLPSWYLSEDGVGVRPHHQAEAEGVDKSMDTLHLDKIAMSDELLVIDVCHYIGDSTNAEIAFAESRGVPVRYLSKERPEWLDRPWAMHERSMDRQALIDLCKKPREDHSGDMCMTCWRCSWCCKCAHNRHARKPGGA